MRRLLYIYFAVLCGNTVMGQTPDTPNSASIHVNVNATVVESIEMVTISDFNIGPVQPSQKEINIDPKDDGGAALLMFSGTPNRQIRVTYTAQVQMTKPGSPSLTAYYSLSGFKKNEQSSSEIFQENPATVTLSNEGVYYVWVGCRLNIEKATSGAYDGDCAIEVEYN